MKHTPGPWRVEEHYGAFRVITASRPIALALYYGGSEDREVMPNARLIAAAPELLEFAQEVVKPPYPDSNLESLLETLRIRAQDVIAKARGES